jgi:5-methylcytosine-specific restriction protein A
MRLTTLKPRIPSIGSRLTQADRIEVERLRGRAAVKRRARFLEDNPLCVHCKAKGRVTAATVPDHITALTNGGQDTEENLQALCEECHRTKTAQDMGNKARRQVGADGWPV